MAQADFGGDALAREQLEEFRSTLPAFTKAYDFFSQIIDYGDTRVEKLAIYAKLLAQAIRSKGGGSALDLDDVVLTHYRLKRQAEADLKLSAGEGQGLKGMTDAGSGVARETKKGTFEELIEQINKLFEGIGLSDEDQINAVSSIMRHAESNEQLQREAVANGPVDFAHSPSLAEAIEEIIYTAGEGHQKAINVLLETSEISKLVELLLMAGLHQRLRDKALQTAAEAE